MKKKLLLTFLPVFLVLTGCNNAKVTNDINKIKEDTLAHEELFGKLSPKKLGEEPVSEWTLAPKIGVQHTSYEEEETTYYAVRYVAAISDLVDGVTASWTRAVASKDATIAKAKAGGFNSTVTYATLNNNGTPMNATDEGEGYTKYIVYTIYNIPESQKDSFMMAYLTLSKAEEEPIVTKIVATRLGGTYSFSFDNDTNGYFLGGKFNGSSTSIMPNALADEHSYAVFENMDIRRDDYFGVFSYTGDEFKYYGYSSFYNYSYTHFMNNNEVAKAKYRGEYLIKVSKDEGTKNQVLITRNTLRLDYSTVDYGESVYITMKKGSDATFQRNFTDEEEGYLFKFGGGTTYYFYLRSSEHHIFNMKSFTVKYHTDLTTFDNTLKITPQFYYVASVDNYIYGEYNTYFQNKEYGYREYTDKDGDGTYTYEFNAISVPLSGTSGNIVAYPNCFDMRSEPVGGGVNAAFYIEYIEIAFANELI